MSRRKQTINLGFICLACDHLFKQRVPALYIDTDSLNQDDLQTESPDRSPYIVPQRVVCPNCEAVDQFDLAAGSNLRVLLAMLLYRYAPFLAPSRIRPLVFTVSDGRRMHPLDAIEMYAEEVARQPKQVDLRRRYANLLHNFGYMAEAETQYRTILKQDPHVMEALMGLAAIHAARDETDQTRHYLELITKRISRSNYPHKEDLLADIQPYLEGTFPLNSFETEFRMLK